MTEAVSRRHSLIALVALALACGAPQAEPKETVPIATPSSSPVSTGIHGPPQPPVVSIGDLRALSNELQIRGQRALGPGFPPPSGDFVASPFAIGYTLAAADALLTTPLAAQRPYHGLTGTVAACFGAAAFAHHFSFKNTFTPSREGTLAAIALTPGSHAGASDDPSDAAGCATVHTPAELVDRAPTFADLLDTGEIGTKKLPVSGDRIGRSMVAGYAYFDHCRAARIGAATCQGHPDAGSDTSGVLSLAPDAAAPNAIELSARGHVESSGGMRIVVVSLGNRTGTRHPRASSLVVAYSADACAAPPAIDSSFLDAMRRASAAERDVVLRVRMPSTKVETQLVVQSPAPLDTLVATARFYANPCMESASPWPLANGEERIDVDRAHVFGLLDDATGTFFVVGRRATSP